MAVNDPTYDYTPVLTNRGDRGPSVTALRAAIAGSGVAASYPSRVLDAMTKDDLIFVCKTHSIAVTGL